MLQILLVMLLMLIFLQDLKTRSVYWFLFPVLMALSFIFAWRSITWAWAWNIGFLLLMMTVLTVYVSLKESRLVNITKGYFSWGDILFLLAVTPLFSLQLYVFFFTAGTVISLLIHLVSMRFHRQDTIPYAGYMSLFLIPFIVFKDFMPGYLNFYA